MLKPQGLITAVGVLAILGGYAWWANRHPTSDKSPEDKNSPKILTLAADQITGIKLIRTGADTVVLTKSGDKWQITAPQELPADSDAVNGLTGAVAPLTSDRLIEEKPQSLAPFGLDQPVSEVDITTKDGQTRKLLFGSDTVSGSDTYAKLANDPKVYTIASYTKSSLDKSLNDLRDKRLMALNSDKITSVTLNAKGPAVEFSKNASGDWQITKPKPMRADGGEVDDLVSKLKDAKMDLSSTPTSADFANATKLGTATFVDDKGPQSIEVRKAKSGDIYAKSTAVGGVYKVAADIGTAIDKSAEDFENKKLFDFGFTDPAKLDLAGKHYEKSGDKWFSGSQQIDSTSLQDVIDKLRDLSAVKFSDRIAGSPVLTLAVTWGEKGKVDKVTIDKNGADYIGVRDGDPTGYALDAKTVDDLQKTIAAIKPYQAPASGAKK
jgi:hypothetical protein